MMRKLSVIVFVLLLSGCGWLYQLGGVSSSSDFDISKANLKVPTFEYVNQYDEPFGTEQLQGKYWLADTIFTFCPSVCPIMTPNMQRLQQTMKDEGISMSFVSFTVDPKRDTPEQLLSYGKNVGADLDSWHFLTGYTLDEIADFSDEAFNTIVQEIEDSDDIMHSTSFFLVDPEGNVIRKYDGLATEQTEIIEDLIKTVKD